MLLSTLCGPEQSEQDKGIPLKKIVEEIPGPLGTIKTKMRTMTIGESIEFVDVKFGLARPIIVLGMACLQRCVSVRSRDRVITHAILNMTSRAISSNLQQMFMRAAGMTKHVRELQGFTPTVQLVCRELDYKIVRGLYKLTKQVLATTGSGAIEDLEKFLDAEVSG